MSKVPKYSRDKRDRSTPNQEAINKCGGGGIDICEIKTYLFVFLAYPEYSARKNKIKKVPW